MLCILQDEEPNTTTNNNDIECKIVHLVEMHVGAQEVFLVWSCCKWSAFVINSLERTMLI